MTFIFSLSVILQVTVVLDCGAGDLHRGLQSSSVILQTGDPAGTSLLVCVPIQNTAGLRDRER